MRRTLLILGLVAAAAVVAVALRGRSPEISGNATPSGELDRAARAATRADTAPIDEAAPPSARPERPPDAAARTAPPRSEPPPESYPPSVIDRGDEKVLGAWMHQDDAAAHNGLTVPPRTYRGFTPTTPAMATGLMLCDLHPDLPKVIVNPELVGGPCAADTELMEHIARGADATTGLWAPNSENLLRDFLEEHGPFTVEKVICGDSGCIVDGMSPSLRKVPFDESLAADFEAIAKLRAEPWYRLYFEGGGGRTIAPGDPATLTLERVLVLKRRTTP